MKKLAVGVLIGLPILIVFFMWMNYTNSEVKLKNLFQQKIDQRTSFYDKMWKTISGKSQVATKVDTSFINVVNAQMAGQKDGEQVTWKWIQQSNPTASFGEVSRLYQDLSRTIESERNGFYVREQELQDIKREHDNLLNVKPACWFVGSRTHLAYKPITSTRTNNVMESGKDDNDKVF